MQYSVLYTHFSDSQQQRTDYKKGGEENFHFETNHFNILGDVVICLSGQSPVPRVKVYLFFSEINISLKLLIRITIWGSC